MFITKKNKKAKTCEGFTLTEIIVVIVIIAALALILIPNMLKMMPNDHNLKYKKAFYTIQEIVADIASECQGMTPGPGGSWTITNDETNVLSYCYDSTPSAKTLENEICDRLSTTGTCPSNATDMKGILTTNGMRWNLIGTRADGQSLGTSEAWGPVTIYVDIDGCGNNTDNNYTGNFGAANGGTCVNPASSTSNQEQGVYGISIRSNGKVTALGNAEQQLLLDKPTDN